MPTSMHHTGMTVRDVKRSTEFYEQLGFVRSFPEPVEVTGEAWAETVIGLDKPSLLVMFVSIGEQQLELIQFLRPEGSQSSSTGSNDVGDAHIALSVDDVRAEYDRLNRLGVNFVSEPVTVTDGTFAGVTAVYGRDPDGYTFELLSGL